jgi:hypothetical protein
MPETRSAVCSPEEIVALWVRGNVGDALAPGLFAQLRALPEEELVEAARQTTMRPHPATISPAGRLIMNAALAAQWLRVFDALDLPREATIFEPCAGGSEPVVVATQVHTGGRGRYVTLNLNRPLAQELRGKIAHLPLPIQIIEDNAARALEYLPRASFDAACFHHAINDILQTASAEPRGWDTTTLDWWPNERQMIEWLWEDVQSGAVEELGKRELLGIIGLAIELVRPKGWLIFDHWTYLGHSQMAWFPWELFNDLIPMTRRWITEAGLPLWEVDVDGLDKQWWMVMQT